MFLQLNFEILTSSIIVIIRLFLDSSVPTGVMSPYRSGLYIRVFFIILIKKVFQKLPGKAPVKFNKEALFDIEQRIDDLRMRGLPLR